MLDESTAMLDPQGRNEVLSVAKALNKEQGTTVINITHYMDEVVGADRVFVMNKGEIVLCGTPQEIFKDREKIAQFGLELPLSTTIADELKQGGFDVGSDVLTEQQLFDAINKRLEGLCK